MDDVRWCVYGSWSAHAAAVAPARPPPVARRRVDLGMSAESPTGRKPHVALAIEALHDTSGGAERVLADVANGLFRRGYRVSVITYQSRNGPSFYPLDFGIERLDARPRHVERRASSPLDALNSAAARRWPVAIATWTLKYVPKTYRLRQVLRASRPDVVVAFMPSMFPYVTLATLGTSAKTIASIHNVPNRELGGDPQRWDQNLVDIKIRRWTLGRAAAVTVLLPSFVDQIPRRARATTVVIPNMVEPYRGPLADVSSAPVGNTILAVGRLSPAKDHATLIRAWAEIAPRYPNWQVRIIGDGPLRQDLDDLRDELAVERLVIDEPTSAIREAYTSSKILAMPSLHEGFGLVTAEAMACGLPVVGFADCEGTNEIVLPGVNGLLVDGGAERAAALAKGLAELIEDEELRIRLGRRAPSTVERFDPDRTLDLWESLITKVAERG